MKNQVCGKKVKFCGPINQADWIQLRNTTDFKQILCLYQWEICRISQITPFKPYFIKGINALWVFMARLSAFCDIGTENQNGQNGPKNQAKNAKKIKKIKK